MAGSLMRHQRSRGGEEDDHSIAVNNKLIAITRLSDRIVEYYSATGEDP
jgi:hypothetical protein